MLNHVHLDAAPPRDPAWRARISLSLLGLILLWPVFRYAEFKPWELIDAQSAHATAQFVAQFFPPELSPEFLRLILAATWQTIAIATAGLSLALLGAIPAAYLIAHMPSPARLGVLVGQLSAGQWLGRILGLVLRWCLMILRSVPELVWALLFVRIVGLGATAGVLAIALSYTGMLAKVYAEIIESSDSSAGESLLRQGCSRFTALLYGTLPSIRAELYSYTIYRWECAIRGSVIMGFVGAGGLGQRMDESLKMLNGAEVATILCVFVLLIALADGFSQLVRRHFSA
ncbi:MAG: ABC transporter permease [Burkholderiales bacterium]|nr:ABC transporter permease [Burkholderiales bacterium]